MIVGHQRAADEVVDRLTVGRAGELAVGRHLDHVVDVVRAIAGEGALEQGPGEGRLALGRMPVDVAVAAQLQYRVGGVGDPAAAIDVGLEGRADRAELEVAAGGARRPRGQMRPHRVAHHDDALGLELTTCGSSVAARHELAQQRQPHHEAARGYEESSASHQLPTFLNMNASETAIWTSSSGTSPSDATKDSRMLSSAHSSSIVSRRPSA